ncbi:MAG TPA: FKBP-type peptidyl-prolyl cis-trans isomerase [Nitrospiraceae bacterium]|nr:FKBP-type peptidyl-prolyl cis-trans isomerase [Nitrospiraceae bacterium]
MRGVHHNKPAVALITIMTFLGLSVPQILADSPQIVEGSNVTFFYHITVPGEQIVLKDVGQFVQGQHQLLPVLERQVTGMRPGEEKTIDLSAEEGFGPYDATKKQTISKSDLPKETKEGDVLQNRAGQSATVTRLSDDSAVMDYNHPLAGKPVHVVLRIVRVENP